MSLVLAREPGADTLDSISSATRELNMQGRVLRMIQVNRRQKGHLSSVTYSSAGDEGPIMVGGRAQVASAMKWPSDGTARDPPGTDHMPMSSQ